MTRFLIIILILPLLIINNAFSENISSDDIKINVLKLNNSNIPKVEEAKKGFFLKLEMPKGWYTYYKNGGDTGLGPILKVNNKQTEVFFQKPQVYTSHNLTNFIYLENANFAFFTENDINKDNSIELLICKDLCIPITKKFTITGNEKEISVNDFSLEHNNLDFFIKNNFVYLKVPQGMSTNTMFIPSKDEVIEHGAEQVIENINGINYLKLAMNLYSESEFKEISGIFIEKTKGITYKEHQKETNTTSLIIIALFALLGGVILNLMPCVLPVIGLKVFSLLKHKTKTSRIKSAMSYSLGVFISMMLIVGVLLILKSLGNNLAWGFQLQNDYFIYFMIALLTLVALNLLGLFEFGNGISNKANKLNLKYSNDFFTGVLTTFVATPCTAPFMATSLGFALSSDSNIITFVVFGFLALGISLPIIIIAFMPKSKILLPKPGKWSDNLRKILALPIILTIIWLVWVLQDIKKPEHIEFNKKEIARLNKEGYDVFVDFTAKWCLTCQYNKIAIIETDDIQKLMKDNNIVYMVADWTTKNDIITNELKALNRAGVPTYVIYEKHSGNAILLPEILTKDILTNNFNKLK